MVDAAPVLSTRPAKRLLHDTACAGQFVLAQPAGFEHDATHAEPSPAHWPHTPQFAAQQTPVVASQKPDAQSPATEHDWPFFLRHAPAVEQTPSVPEVTVQSREPSTTQSTESVLRLNGLTVVWPAKQTPLCTHCELHELTTAIVWPGCSGQTVASSAASVAHVCVFARQKPLSLAVLRNWQSPPFRPVTTPLHATAGQPASTHGVLPVHLGAHVPVAHVPHALHDDVEQQTFSTQLPLVQHVPSVQSAHEAPLARFTHVPVASHTSPFGHVPSPITLDTKQSVEVVHEVTSASATHTPERMHAALPHECVPMFDGLVVSTSTGHVAKVFGWQAPALVQYATPLTA